MTERSEVTETVTETERTYFGYRTNLRRVTMVSNKRPMAVTKDPTSRTTCLLSFSGGLDSVAAAIQLERDGYDVTLGHIEWYIAGTDFGQNQTQAAQDIAKELDMPLEILAHMWFPEASYAKYSWVPVCISTIMHHAGDCCEYPGPPACRFDSVGFGFDGIPYEGDNCEFKQQWIQGMRGYAYQGDILFPNQGKSRWAGHYDDIIPKHLWDMTVSCYQGVTYGDCPGCPKCIK